LFSSTASVFRGTDMVPRDDVICGGASDYGSVGCVFAFLQVSHNTTLQTLAHYPSLSSAAAIPSCWKTSTAGRSR
jgi:hypothetical protein